MSNKDFLSRLGEKEKAYAKAIREQHEQCVKTTAANIEKDLGPDWRTRLVDGYSGNKYSPVATFTGPKDAKCYEEAVKHVMNGFHCYNNIRGSARNGYWNEVDCYTESRR